MKPKLTYFYTNQCPKCQELKQIFELTSVNTYEEDMLVESLDVKWVPTFMLEDQNGKHKFEGVKEITEFLKKVIL